LTQNFNNSYGPCKFFEKKEKTSHLNHSGYIEGGIMQNHQQKKISEKKWKTKILWAKQTSFLAPCPSALGHFQPHGFM
jgi:hypothetical protein